MFELGKIFPIEMIHEAELWCKQRGYMIDQDENGELFIYENPTLSEEEMALEIAKDERANKVKEIKVTVDGMVFDGDETSQARMARAITMANIAGLTTTNWVLADNTIAEVTVAQIAQALVLAGQKQTELWVMPYTEVTDGAESD